MKIKLLVSALLALSSVSAHAVMQRTFLIEAQIEGIVVCQAAIEYSKTGNPNVSFEKVTNELIRPVRAKPNSEGDFIEAGTKLDQALDTVDHDAWYYGLDVAKDKSLSDENMKNACVYGSLSNVKHMAIKMGAQDFVDQNPDVFKGIE